ncbi:hypothetical protein Poly24_19970 [Rosistilla carotiformis]|uniref:Uncharacterized protein n=1 Tax=Rosistilla carotiformis TaxID=2528017 RepID=A0A518JRX3_9BACT|nr:hypothetical protein [Rosistilla carotiformis]QDV68288.1 hypothetical protein Poly24_19970 [Rosistilla carotiformis]
MGRAGSFLLGVAVGAGTLYTAMNYHVVRSDAGTHLVRKTEVGLGGTYADIREFSMTDWRQRPQLTQAMLQAQRSELMPATPTQSLQQRVGSIFGGVLGHRQ